MADNNSEARYHALDNLRAIMMWLGIVIHVCGPYLVRPVSNVPLRDATSTPWADLLGPTIHAFRMPVFFMMAGFLAAMLLERRGPTEFLKHRAMRLALPFAVFWPVIMGAMELAMGAFQHRSVHGTWGYLPAPLPGDGPRWSYTGHMWFLWMLFWFCVAVSLLARLPGAQIGRAHV